MTCIFACSSFFVYALDIILCSDNWSNFQGKVRYVVRPVLPVGCKTKTSLCGALGTNDPVNLGGYGVELALKNLEYKAMDDSLIKKSE